MELVKKHSAECRKPLSVTELDEAGCHKIKPEMYQTSHIHTLDIKVKDTEVISFFFPLTQAHKTVNDTHTRAYTPTHTVIQYMNTDAHTPTHNEISHTDARHIHIHFPKGEERQH